MCSMPARFSVDNDILISLNELLKCAKVIANSNYKVGDDQQVEGRFKDIVINFRNRYSTLKNESGFDYASFKKFMYDLANIIERPVEGKKVICNTNAIKNEFVSDVLEPIKKASIKYGNALIEEVMVDSNNS